jgi:Tol biopolymer transport system component
MGPCFRPVGSKSGRRPQRLLQPVELHLQPVEELVNDESSGRKAGNATAILNGIHNEYQPIVSPDGRWLAYVSDESGRDHVYVRPFRRAGGRKQVSVAGGRAPVWPRTSAEILYGLVESNQGQIMIARTR